MLKISIIQIFDTLEYIVYGNKWNLGTFKCIKKDGWSCYWIWVQGKGGRFKG